MANVGFPDAFQETQEFKATAKNLDLNLSLLEIRQPRTSRPPLTTSIAAQDCLYVCPNPLALTQRIRIISLALQARVSTMSGFREFTEAGGLMSYGKCS